MNGLNRQMRRLEARQKANYEERKYRFTLKHMVKATRGGGVDTVRAYLDVFNTVPIDDYKFVIKPDAAYFAMYDERGRLHNDQGPAQIFTVYSKTTPGVLIWYQHGVIHREGAPAIIKKNGTEKWYRNGVLHREDGPAIYNKVKGIEMYYKDGVQVDRLEVIPTREPDEVD